MLSKEQKLELTSLLIAEEHVTNFPKSINVKKIADLAGVSRAWIYKYFGASDQDIICTAIDCVVSQITELTLPTNEIPSRAEWVKEFISGLEKTMKEVETYPVIFRFYLLSTVYQDKFFERFKLHETLFLEGRAIPLLRKSLKLSLAEARSMAEMLHSLRLGVALTWLSEPDKTSLKRSRILGVLKNQLFEELFLS